MKGNQSLGIMIIEGKHAEVGQGIFVSDIQEGSNAEKVSESRFIKMKPFLIQKGFTENLAWRN